MRIASEILKIGVSKIDKNVCPGHMPHVRDEDVPDREGLGIQSNQSNGLLGLGAMVGPGVMYFLRKLPESVKMVGGKK